MKLSFIKLLYYVLLFSIPCALQAQREALNWHFGFGINVIFVDGQPTLGPTSALETLEGCASISDPVTGELLFYTNGGGRPTDISGQNPGMIWNANDEVIYDMMGAEGGGFSARQSSIFFPVPGSNTQYYLFTMEEFEFNVGGGFPDQVAGRGLSYFIVDRELNDGTGGVTLADQRVFTPTSEGLSATPMRGGVEGHWVVCHGRNNDALVITPVTAMGVGEPVIYPVDATVEGAIKMSPNGQWIFNNGQIFNFDPVTGVVTAAAAATFANPNSFTASFTPDSRYFYTIINFFGERQLTRYDMLATDIVTSGSILSILMDQGLTKQMQIGPNGSLYFMEETFDGLNFLSEINCPSAVSPELNRYVLELPMGNTVFFSSLPNFVDAIFEPLASINDTLFFANDTTQICPLTTTDLRPFNQGMEYAWSTGSNDSIITVGATGEYDVTITGGCQITVESFSVVVQPELSTTIEPSNPDLFFCPGEAITFRLISNQPLELIEWPDGSSTDTFTTVIIPTDSVLLRVGTACEQQTISYTFPPEPLFSPVLLEQFSDPLCPGDEVELMVSGDFIDAVSWEDSSTDNPRIISADSSLIYQVTVFSLCNDSIRLTAGLDYSNCPLVCDFQLPELITPNGDGTNDRFRVYAVCELEDFQMRIFNRWGQEVFSSNSQTQTWDGTVNGVPQPMDQYLYQVRFRFPNNPDLEMADGEFSLIR